MYISIYSSYIATIYILYIQNDHHSSAAIQILASSQVPATVLGTSIGTAVVQQDEPVRTAQPRGTAGTGTAAAAYTGMHIGRV